ncbi:MAG: hypothetical protein D8M58_07735 [Calditrichaeota bacterium]|nr:MAG: hypothetical protein DWQ03_18755 [Calditrichota bacterium]MBL1205271.1 hypothetical protein [Calditrichota bacterium]
MWNFHIFLFELGLWFFIVLLIFRYIKGKNHLNFKQIYFVNSIIFSILILFTISNQYFSFVAYETTKRLFKLLNPYNLAKSIETVELHLMDSDRLFFNFLMGQCFIIALLLFTFIFFNIRLLKKEKLKNVKEV